MEQRIGLHTTLSIVPKSGTSSTGGGGTPTPTPRPAFAKRSGGGGGGFSFPRPGGIIPPQNRVLAPPRPRMGVVVVGPPPPSRMPPPSPRSIPPAIRAIVATPTTTTPPDLESMYLVTLLKAENRVKIFLSPGKEANHNSSMSKAIIQILEERGLYNKKMNASVHKGLSQVVYDKLIVGGSPFSWIHPLSRKKTTFIVKYVYQSRAAGAAPGAVANLTKPVVVGGVGVARSPHSSQYAAAAAHAQAQGVSRGRGRPRKQEMIPSLVSPGRGRGRGGGVPRPKAVEVIDLDSDEEDEQEAEEEEEDDDDFNDNLFVLKKPSSISKRQIPSAKAIPQIANAQIKSSCSTSSKPSPAAASVQNSRRVSSSDPLAKMNANVKTPTPTPSKVERNVSVARGKYFNFPSKSIIPPSKSLSCHYRIPDMKKFNQAHSKSKISVEVHPFLGDRFKVVWNDSPAPTQKSGAPNSKHVLDKKDKRKTLEDLDIVIQPESRKRARNSSDMFSTAAETRSLRRQPQPPPATAKNKNAPLVSSTSRNSSTRAPPPTRRQNVREFNPSGSEEDESGGSSGSDSSSSSSSATGSGSDSESSASDVEFDVGRSKRGSAAAVAAANKKSVPKSTKRKSAKSSSEEDEPWDLKHDIFKPPPKCFIQAKPCRPLRKSADGRIYFSLKSKVGLGEHYKNEDLFVNWEKFVRTESVVGSYYKTQLILSAHTVFAIYHMERDQEKLVLERSVEMVSDGTIKIRLHDVDVTSTFMQYINIDTNTHLSCLLTNLLNSHLCPGCPNFPLVSIYPEACLRDGIWTSKRCSGVVFHDVDKFISPGTSSNKQPQPQPKTLCPACKELKIRLEEETWELIKLSREYKLRMEAIGRRGAGARRGRGRGGAPQKQTLIYGTYKPPSPPPGESPKKGIQVRESLSHLFLDFWKELGFKEEEFPKETKDLKVATVTEKDFPIVEQDPNPIPGLLPIPLPESIPILENIDFDENGQTMLTFAEVPLNPYDASQNGSINIQFMNGCSNLPNISSDVIDSLMNSAENPDGLVQALAGGTPGQGQTEAQNPLNFDHTQFQAPSTNPNQQQSYDPHSAQYSYNDQQQFPHLNPPTQQDDQVLHDSSLEQYLSTGMEPHNIIDFEQNLDFHLNDDVSESSLMFPTFSLTEL